MTDARFDLRRRYAAAPTFAEMLASATKNVELWNALYDRAAVDPTLLERLEAVGRRWHLLVISEDWCGDAVNTLPVVARLVEASPWLDMRVFPRDANPDIMDAHLTNGARSIPVVAVLDEEFAEHGWWGPRPTELQSWVMTEGRGLPKDERYRHVRTWYARDRGRTTALEIVSLIERAAAAPERLAG